MSSRIRFGTDGWRSRVDADFSADTVRRVAKAITDYLISSKPPGRGIFLGYDGRGGSKNFAGACAEVLATNGIESLIPSRPVPTPVAAFTAVKLSLQGSIMITASHNPPAYNGIKFIPHYGGPATTDITESIERMIPAEVPHCEGYGKLERKGLISVLDPVEDYLSHIQRLLSVNELKIKVTVDPMHGASSGVIDRILSRLNAEVRVVRGNIDPLFGGSIPDPVPSNLNALRSEVLGGGSALGLALDGDGDRLAAVTEKGTFLMANQLLPLIYLHMNARRSLAGDAARTVATSHLLDAVATSHGRRVIEVPVGFKYIGALLRERRVVVGGEESGGISLVTHIPEKDGIASALLVIESVVLSGESLHSIMERIYGRYGRFESARLDLRVDRLPDASLREIEAKIGDTILRKRVSGINRMDGLKVMLSDGSWLLFRRSGTENVVRVYAESSRRGDTDNLLDLGGRIVLSGLKAGH
ncbi:MAG: phosphoglucomutase/phosphomannomutase family protein [Candidatus Verstraetearchaeota archaeon]|nr:phosphoglucomutase/phosphomannomutase family protein [Candidatus Verstraetearchaeota archaeon]